MANNPSRASRYRVAVSVLAAVALVTPAGAAYGTTSVTYNRTAAVAYADLYSCNGTQCRNPSYASFGSDCTNFASQTLHAGGQPYIYNNAAGTSPEWRPYLTTWNTVSGFLAYWRNTRSIVSSFTVIDKTNDYTPAANGDFYAYDWGKGDGISHLSIEAGYGVYNSDYGSGRGDFMDQHSTDRHHAPYNWGYRHPDSSVDPSKMKIYLVHLKDSWSY